MTKQHGPVLSAHKSPVQTQTAQATKKTVLALAALLSLQVAAFAYTSYDGGWKIAGECWCDFHNSSNASQDMYNCTKSKCEQKYGVPNNGNNHEYYACIAGARDEFDNQASTGSIPACTASSTVTNPREGAD